MKQQSIVGFVDMMCLKSRCIASFATNVLIRLIIIACVSSLQYSCLLQFGTPGALAFLTDLLLSLLTIMMISFDRLPSKNTGLNTCVGKANYEFFFRTMLSIATMLTLHGIMQIGIILDIFFGSGATRDRAESWFGSNRDTSVAVVSIMGVFILFDVLALSLMVQLLAFHFHLRRQGLTTYQYIYQDNRKKGEIRKLKRDLESHRMVAMGKAQEEGRTCEWFQLRIGGLLREKVGCARCDPLKLEGEGQPREQQKKQPQKIQQSVVQNGNGAHVVLSKQGESVEVSVDPEESKEPEDEK